MKKLHLDENFDNVQVDVQAVGSPAFVDANEEHDRNKKNYEDALEANKKDAESTIPKEGDTGKEVKSPALKKMHLSEDIFDEALEGVSLTEGTNDLEVNLINYIKKFQKHYHIDSQAMGKALAQIGKSIEILNPSDGLSESLDESMSSPLDEMDKQALVNSISDLLFDAEPSKAEALEILKSVSEYISKFDDEVFIYPDEEGYDDMFESVEEDTEADLKESLVYNVAKEQINRFNEGKMGENWNPQTYVERLVNKKYLDESQAASLLESVKK